MAPPPTTPPAAAAPAHRSGRRRLRLALRLLTLCLLTVGALVCVLAWLSLSPQGAQFVAAQATRVADGALRLDGVQGRLGSRLQIAHLSWRSARLTLDLRELDLAWQPRALLQRRLQIAHLSAASLEIRSAPSNEPATAPAALHLPLQLQIDALRLGRLAVGGLPAAAAPARVWLTEARGRLDYTLARYQVELTAQTEWGQAQLGGSLAATRPFALSARGALAARLQAKPVSLALTASGDLLAPHIALALAGEGAEGGGALSLAPFAPQPLRSAQLALHGLDPARFLPDVPSAQLELALNVVPHGAGYAGPLRLRNHSPAMLDGGGLPFTHVAAELQWSSDALRASDLLLELPDGGSARGELTWRADAQHAPGWFDGALQLRAFDPQQLHSAAPRAQFDGRLALRRVAVAQRLEVALSEPRLALQAQADFGAQALTLERLLLTSAGARLQAQGRLRLDGAREFALDGRLQGFDPARWHAAAPSGRIDASLQASGALAPDWRLQLALDLAASRLRDQPLAGRARLQAAPGRLQVAELALALGNNQLQAEGAWGAVGDVLRFDLAAPRLAQFGQGVSGAASVQGRISGTPLAPAGQAQFSASGLRAGALRLTQAEGHLTLDEGEDAPVAARVHLAGLQWGEDERWALHEASLDLRGRRSMHDLALQARLGPSQQLALQLAGGLGAGQWRGQLARLEASGAPLALRLLEAVPLSVGGPAGWGAGELGAARLDSSRGSIQLEPTRWGPDGLHSAGRLSGLEVGLTLDAQQQIVARGRTLSLGAQWAVDLQQHANGYLKLYREAGDLLLTGDAPVALGLTELLLTVVASDDRLALALSAAGEKIGVISASATALAERGPEGWRLAPHAALLGSAHVEVPSIAWIGPLLDQGLKTEGSLRGDFSLAGSPAQLESRGSVHGADLALALTDYGLRLSGGRARLSVDAEQLRLDELEFVSPNRVNPADDRIDLAALTAVPGRLSGSGGLRLADGHGSLQLQAERLPILQETHQWLLLSGRLQAETAPQALTLQAQLRADAAFVGLPKAVRPSLGEDVVVLGRSAPRRSLDVHADVGVDLGDAFYVKARGLNSRLAGELQLRLRGREPLAASGTIAPRGGVYEAYGQRLQLRRSALTFRGPLDDPALNITALRTGLPVEAGVHVFGTARNPRVRLVSEPNVPDVEKLSWLVLGRGTDANGAGDAALLLSAASGLLAGEGDGVPQQIVQGLGFDSISLGSGSLAGSNVPLYSQVAAGATGLGSVPLGGETASGQILSVGKRLSDKLTLAFEQNLAGSESIVKLSYALARSLSLILRAGSDNAVDLHYTLSFR